MKVTDVRVGMHLKRKHASGQWEGPFDREVVVTEITEKGFKFDYIDGETRSLHPRLGMTMLPNGHEEYGINGETDFEIVPSLTGEACQPKLF